MKARVKLGGVIMELLAEHIDQQTCRETTFRGVPVSAVDTDALILANKANGDITWYRHGADNEFITVDIPTELITWEE